MNDMLNVMRTVLGIEDDGQDALLSALLAQAQAEALAVTGRETLPAGLRGAVVDLAVMRYNRRGTEGESRRTEGGVTAVMEALPENIRRQLRQYTLAKAGVKRCEAE